MSNNSNYIQTTENVQQPKKYYSYLYEIKHLPTGLLYVGSRSRNDVLKTYEDCFNDDYLGSSCRDEGPFSKKDTETNPQDYAKTILQVFHDEDPKKAWRNEHGSNGLIMTYWTMYGKDKVLNKNCVLNDGSKVFSNAGNTHTQEAKQKMSEAATKQWEDMSPEKREEISQKQRETWENKSEEEKEEINQKKSEAAIKQWDNKSEEEKEEISQNMSATATKRWEEITPEKKAEVSQNMSDGQKKRWEDMSPEKKAEINQKQSEANKGENNGTYTMFQHPYKFGFIGNALKVSNDIKKNYPNEKQWNQLTIKERQSYKIVSPE